MQRFALLVLLPAAACAGPCQNVEPRPNPVPSPPVVATAPEPPAGPALELAPVASGWGSTGVTAANRPVPYWVIATADVHALRDVEGLALEGVDLLDAEGRVVGTGTRELELRVVGPDRSAGDFSQHGTTPFDGRVRAGERVRLWVHARLDDEFDGRAPAVRFRARLRVGAGGPAVVEGTLGPQWPTA